MEYLALIFADRQRLTHVHVRILLRVDVGRRLHALVVVFEGRFVSSGALVCGVDYFRLTGVELHD